MWRIAKTKSGAATRAPALFLVAVAAAYVIESYYHQLVRFFFKLFNGDEIQFSIRSIPLPPSYIFAIAFGLFTSLSFLLLIFTSLRNRIERTCYAILIFFASTISVTAIDSKRVIATCTACNGGIKHLSFRDPSYNEYFMLSLASAFAYLLTKFALDRKRLNQINESK